MVLFSIFVDDLVLQVTKANSCRLLNFFCFCLFLFAGDLLLLSPSITDLQSLFSTCERELEELDMCYNDQLYYVLWSQYNCMYI